MELVELCQQILALSSICPMESGRCPADKAWEMVDAWLGERNLAPGHPDVPEVVTKICSADGQGRWCEIGEMQLYAKQFLESSGSS